MILLRTADAFQPARQVIRIVGKDRDFLFSGSSLRAHLHVLIRLLPITCNTAIRRPAARDPKQAEEIIRVTSDNIHDLSWEEGMRLMALSPEERIAMVTNEPEWVRNKPRGRG